MTLWRPWRIPAIVAALATDGLVLPSTINGLEQVWVSAYEEPLARRIPARAGFGSSTSGPDALAAKKLSEPDQRRPCPRLSGHRTGSDDPTYVKGETTEVPPSHMAA